MKFDVSCGRGPTLLKILHKMFHTTDAICEKHTYAVDKLEDQIVMTVTAYAFLEKTLIYYNEKSCCYRISKHAG